MKGCDKNKACFVFGFFFGKGPIPVTSNSLKSQLGSSNKLSVDGGGNGGNLIC